MWSREQVPRMGINNNCMNFVHRWCLVGRAKGYTRLSNGKKQTIRMCYWRQRSTFLVTGAIKLTQCEMVFFQWVYYLSVWAWRSFFFLFFFFGFFSEAKNQKLLRITITTRRRWGVGMGRQWDPTPSWNACHSRRSHLWEGMKAHLTIFTFGVCIWKFELYI